MTLPMSVLLSVLLGFSRLSSDSEMVALWAGGIGLWRLMRPVITLAMCVTMFSFALNEWAVPAANRRISDIRSKALKLTTPIENAFLRADMQDGKYTSVVLVNGGMKDRQLRDVTVLTGFTPKGPKFYFSAARAKWESGDKWTLYDGTMHSLGAAQQSHTNFREFKSQPIILDGTPEEIAAEQRDSNEMSFKELARKIQRVRKTQDTREFEVDLYNKIALPFASLVFALLAAPLGLRPQRSGSGVGFGLSIGLIFAYWMVWQYTSTLAKTGTLAPIAGSFLADISFLVIGVSLIVRKSR
ncbi:MAG: LptF/LptG family permease [Armatimonadota bacterium]